MTDPEITPGTLTLDVESEGKTFRLRTVAPFVKVDITTEPTYEEPRDIPFGPLYVIDPPKLRYMDLSVRVRMEADSTPDGTLYQMIESPPAPHPDVATLGDIAARLREMVTAGAAIESIQYALTKVTEEQAS